MSTFADAAQEAGARRERDALIAEAEKLPPDTLIAVAFEKVGEVIKDPRERAIIQRYLEDAHLRVQAVLSTSGRVEVRP